MEHAGFVIQRREAVALRASQQSMGTIITTTRYWYYWYCCWYCYYYCSLSSSEVAAIASAVKAVELPGVVPYTDTAWAAAEELLALNQVSPPHGSGLVEIVFIVFYSQLFTLQELFGHQDNSYLTNKISPFSFTDKFEKIIRKKK